LKITATIDGDGENRIKTDTGMKSVTAWLESKGIMEGQKN
jgi:hypothetical protein